MNVEVISLPPAPIAYLRHTGPYGAAVGQWMPASAWQLDDRPFFEYYAPDAAFDAATGRFSCQICVPVVRLS